MLEEMTLMNWRTRKTMMRLLSSTSLLISQSAGASVRCHFTPASSTVVQGWKRRTRGSGLQLLCQ
uniref:Uncharacterized protein n=1 Tax=Arundo donax TaxID=35708 RepID=A0A0A9EF10_ARUDO